MDKNNQTAKHSHAGHRQRMKQRFMATGFEGMADHEVLEYLLFYVLKQGDTNEVAHRLVETFGSLNGVIEADYNSLLEVKGIKENAACYLKSFLPLFRRYKKSMRDREKFEIDDCCEFLFGYYLGLKNEKVMAVLLDSSCKIINVETVCEGDICSASFNLRRLVELVVKNKASAMIIAHNHPGGLAIPSREDIDATISIKNSLAAIGVALLDHIVYIEDDYVSMSSTASFTRLFK